MLLARLFRVLDGPLYELDSAAFATYWLIQARKIGASMDRLARALR
jgi:hypothetical protein